MKFGLNFIMMTPRGKKLKGRKECKSCGTNFKDSGSDVALAFTNKGNKILCQGCTDYFEGEGIDIIIRKTDG
jgi:hypothetical protein